MRQFLFIFLAIFALSAISSQAIAGDLKDDILKAVEKGKKDPPKPATTKPTRARRSAPKPPAMDLAALEALSERLEKIEELFKEINLTSENFDEFFAPRTVPFILMTILLIVLWAKRGGTVRKNMLVARKLAKAHKDENLKAKYDALKRDHDTLKRDHDALEQRLQNLENA